MNSAPLLSARIPGFKVVSKHQLDEICHGTTSAFYVLLGRHGPPEDPRESILFVEYVDDLLAACQQRIDEFWDKHRVMITHVAVKPSSPFEGERNLTHAYERALALQELRHKLNPRFRRP
jgi:hypothetical protein